MMRSGHFCESCVSCPLGTLRMTSPPTSSLEDFGDLGRAFRETDIAEADHDTIVRNMISGEYEDPLRVVAFNTVEGWSRDVSEEIAYDVLDRAYDADTTLSAGAKRFIDLHVTPSAKRPPAPSVLRQQVRGAQEGVKAGLTRSGASIVARSASGHAGSLAKLKVRNLLTMAKPG